MGSHERRITRGCRFSLLPLQVFFQADKALVTNDDVVDQFDIEDATGRHELFRRVNILRRRRRIAAGVIVAEDEARAIADDGGAKDLGGAQH